MNLIPLAVLAALSPLFLTACAPAAVRADEPGLAQHCALEAPLGSAVVRRSCTTPMTQVERDAVARDITNRSLETPAILRTTPY